MALFLCNVAPHRYVCFIRGVGPVNVSKFKAASPTHEIDGDVQLLFCCMFDG